MKTIFREYDIRGIFEKELNQKTLFWIGYFLGKEIEKVGKNVAVGYDARTHSPTIFDYLREGLNYAGLEVFNMGLVPTPTNYFSNFVEFDGVKIDGSIMITGSHNPPEYNGLKITIDKKPFFGKDIQAVGEKVISKLNSPIPETVEKRVSTISAKEKYIEYLLNEFSFLKNFNQKIIYDVGNGVAGVVLDEVFEKLGISAKGLFTEPDGTFPNHHPDPTEEKNLKDIRKELETGEFSIGFAFDGDSDRIAVLTKKGESIKGDILALILSENMENPTVVGEVKSSQIMYDTIEKRGGKAVMYKTGHSNIKIKMAEIDASLGVEVSGHIFFRDRYFGFDDAIYTTLRVLELLHSGVNLEEKLSQLPKLFSTEEIKVPTTEERKFQIVDEVKERIESGIENFPKIRQVIDIDGVRVVFENGWGLIRASNTTPVLVARFEADTLENLEKYQKSMLDLLS